MNRIFVLCGALVLGVIVAGTAVSAEDKIDIKTVMKKAHGKGGLLGKTQAAVKGAEWEDVEKMSKEWVKLAAALAKESPDKGEAESWKKLTGSYEKAVKGLATAAGKMDSKGASASLKTIGGSCKACHSVHK